MLKWVTTITIFCITTVAMGQDITLRVHHFMSAKAPLHSKWLAIWEKTIEEKSDGRIQVELYNSMGLGGKPGDLYDQAIDGAVEITLTLTGYTAGRFPESEVFELPFMMTDNITTSKAYYDLVASDLQNKEFEETKILAAWVHGPGVIHSKDPIEKLEDVKGKSLRGPTRIVTGLLGELGANPVGMPLPAIPENLSKGVIDGATLPWEVTPSIKLAELVQNHTEMGGKHALYTATFVLAMNWDVYEALPDDLRAILDDETGKMFSAKAATVMQNADKVGRTIAKDNHIITLDDKETARWVDASKPVYDKWVKEMSNKKIDGNALIKKAKDLIKANQ